GIGGMIGALLRYGLGLILFLHGAGIPLDTLAANWTGCLLLGWLNAHLPASVLLRSGIGTGMIGSFTTFSTFSVETLTLTQKGDVVMAVIYLLLSFWGGILLVHTGSRLGTKRRNNRC